MRAAHAAYDKSYVGDLIEYEAAYEDTFVYLARDYNLGYVELRAANPGVDPWVPGAGTDLIIPTRHLLPDAPREGLVINLPEMRLYAFVNGDGPPATFPLGIGREGLGTPVGTTKIVRKTERPSWRPTERMREEDPELPEVVEPGPENPLGSHALYLGWPQYAIHGTNRPFGIGRRISSGCIRLYPESIEQLYEIVPVGTPVTVVNQPIKVGWIENELYIEAHPSLEDAIKMEESGYIVAPKLSDEDMQRILREAGEHKDKVRWPAVRTAVRERLGYPVPIARRTNISLKNAAVQEAEIKTGPDSFPPESETGTEQEEEDLEKTARDMLEDIYDDEKNAAADTPPQTTAQGSPYNTLNP